MRHLFAIIISALSLSLCAVEYAPITLSHTKPLVSMGSVNNSSYMTTGSTLSANVYEVGAYSPSGPASGPRRAPGTPTGESTYDPNNPQFSPLGDTLIPLLLMVMAYATSILLRRRKSRV